MRICKNHKRCGVSEDCPHSRPHNEIDEYDNSCRLPCDVLLKGAINGSVCIETEKESANTTDIADARR